MKAFLSHSSEDKEYFVDVVARRLGKDRVIYDRFTFEEGMTSVEEIMNGLSETDVFVIFISENALQSDWVKMEITEAKKRLDSGKISRIYPIIIDPNVSYDDKRIPDWLRLCNLQLVQSQVKAASLILKRLYELSYEKHPKLKEKEEIFVGRNEIMNKFELRINDFKQKLPVAIIASGVPKIGRKSFVKKAFEKTNLIRNTYMIPVIDLDSHESIEDFILKISDLGLTQRYDTSNLLTKTIDEKLQISINIVNELESTRQKVIINDRGCIITPSREMVDWFKSLYNAICSMDYVVFAIASKYRIYEASKYTYNNIFYIHIPELDLNERSGLFYRYLKLEDLELKPVDVDFFIGTLSGYPDQAFYAARLIKDLGLARAKERTNLIVEFNTERVVTLINTFEEDEFARGVLALLADYGTIGYNNFFDIVGRTDQANLLLEDFFANGICDLIGINGEYIKLNDVVYDYLSRIGLKIPKEYKIKILESLDDFLNDHQNKEYYIDISEYQYLIKKAIAENRIDSIQNLLIPSHFLKTMKELYDQQKNYNDVIILADRVLANSIYIDEHMKQEIRYFLCMSLARNKDERFYKEVKKIHGAEYFFLNGFYCRQVGKADRAIDFYEKALQKRSPFARAQRDLVQVYLNIEDFEKAYELAKENYENDRKSNPYHIHAYFISLLRNYKITDKEEVLNRLLKELEENKHKKAREFYLRCSSQYQAYFTKNVDEAILIIDTAIEEYPKNHWLLVDKFYICAHHKRIREMESILTEYKKQGRTTEVKNTSTKFEIILASAKGENTKIPNLINKLKHYPTQAIEKLQRRYCQSPIC